MRILFLLLLPLTAHGGVNVVVTLPDLCALTIEVGGADVAVSCIARHSENPHYVDPRPSLLVPLSRADLLVRNGLDLESGWLDPLLVNARNAKIQVGRPGHFVAAAHITPLEVPTKLDRAQGDIHPGGNPHFNFDPRRMSEVVVALGARLGRIDPDHAAGYARRAGALAKALQAFASAQTARYRALPAEKRLLVSYHRSFAYLFDWLQLKAVEHVEPIPGVSPSPGHVVKVMKRMKQTGARLLVQESFYPRKTSQQLSSLVSGALLVIPAATATDHKETYLQHMRHVADELYDALAR